MRAKDQCPSCFQPIAPGDFLCASCELILEPALATTRPVREVSVVRRLLEAPQRGVPSQVPTRPQVPAASLGDPDFEGPTRVMTLPPEVSGVPVVVATLSQKAAPLTELEAWVVSLIDGLSDAPALARKIGFKELELRVLLTVLQSKGVVDFADEPWSNADLNLPSVLGTIDESEDVPVVTGEFDVPPPPPVDDESPRTDQHYVPPRIAPATPGGGSGAVTTPARPAQPRRAEVAPPYPGSSPSRVPAYPGSSPSRPPEELSSNVETVPARPAAAPPYPGAARPPSPPRGVPVAAPKTESTDPRIQYSAHANRRVIDALKQVKRNDAAPTVVREEKEQTYADVMARDTLQVALRMEQNGRLDEAIRFLEKSIAQSPEAPSLYNRLGIILMRERRDYRRAEQLIRKAVELAPENTVYATNLQQVLSRHALSTQR